MIPLTTRNYEYVGILFTAAKDCELIIKAVSGTESCSVTSIASGYFSTHLTANKIPGTHCAKLWLGLPVQNLTSNPVIV